MLGELIHLADGAAADTEFYMPVRRLRMRPSAVMPDRRHATLGDLHPLEVAQVNPQGLVISHERMHVHGISDLGEGGADGLGMHHEAVEVGAAEPSVAEGAPEDASSKEVIVHSVLKPPEDVTSLGVEGLVIAVYLAAQLLLHSNKQ